MGADVLGWKEDKIQFYATRQKKDFKLTAGKTSTGEKCKIRDG